MTARPPPAGPLGATGWLRPFGVLVALAPGCATEATLSREADGLHVRVAGLAEDGYRCAPELLARADAHLAFLRRAMERAEPVEAERRRAAAARTLEDLQAEIEGCRPLDTDQDGVGDPEDRCVLTPGSAQGCPDRDGDGIADLDDDCPDVPEDYDGVADRDGCLDDQDTDGDGVLDGEDACDQVPGPVDHRGCPHGDRDGDGITDPQDRCPDEPEDRDRFEDGDGCPDPDNDADSIADGDDLCPLDPETVNGVQDQDGCPDEKLKLVRVDAEKGKIELSQKVFFAVGRTRIQRRSFDLLDEVAQALRQNPGLRLLVEGHTDSQGAASTNLRLSQRRADAVRRYLVRQGIDPDRLTAIGFGEDKPIAHNRTRAGRERNRRVEFTILPSERESP